MLKLLDHTKTIQHHPPTYKLTSMRTRTGQHTAFAFPVNMQQLLLTCHLLHPPPKKLTNFNAYTLTGQRTTFPSKYARVPAIKAAVFTFA